MNADLLPIVVLFTDGVEDGDTSRGSLTDELGSLESRGHTRGVLLGKSADVDLRLWLQR